VTHTLIRPNDIEVPLNQIGRDGGGLRGDVAARSITVERFDLVRSHDPCDAVLAASFTSLSKIQEDTS
jgi:hypothetical protein